VPVDDDLREDARLAILAAAGDGRPVDAADPPD
jgi:hypothetical protein